MPLNMTKVRKLQKFEPMKMNYNYKVYLYLTVEFTD